MRLRHALRGRTEERAPFAEVLSRLASYFAVAGRMIGQPWQERLPKGMVRR
ncbi:MAG: hypothetical protein FJY95_16650 [Candidatus Handelsmanbacteria bacterium]|nr:hypothetical protein [Candidatus Handelsmanbacteria bacterium]